MEEEAPLQLPVPRARLLCLNVQSTEAEEPPRLLESDRVVQHPAILATPMRAAAQPPRHSARPDFPVFETFLPTMAAVQLH